MHASQLASAQSRQISQQMQIVADAEGLAGESVRQRIADGQIVIPMGVAGNRRIVGVGCGLRT